MLFLDDSPPEFARISKTRSKPLKTKNLNQGSGAWRGSIQAFTLIELLVVMAIIAIMAGLTMGVLSGVQERKRSMEGVNAARNLIAAYNMGCAENNNQYFALEDKSAPPLQKANGSFISDAMARARWTLRTTPYLNFQNNPILFTNEIDEYVKSMGMGSFSDYMYSLVPRFGLNNQFVGGTAVDAGGNMDAKVSEEAALRPSDLPRAIIALVSARQALASDEGFPGYYRVRPPREYNTDYWNTRKWTTDSNPSEFGYIDASYGGKAICAYTDGTVRLQDMEELKDMRFWSKKAVEANKPDY